ncbi:MAG: hypothetical protein O7H41_20320 [Planctomycetota bacterium]|nr:hypothetical protein [Planctomycetota bacterium]
MSGRSRADHLLTAAAASELLSIHPKTAAKKMREGRFGPIVRFPGGGIRIRASVLGRWISDHEYVAELRVRGQPRPNMLLVEALSRPARKRRRPGRGPPRKK